MKDLCLLVFKVNILPGYDFVQSITVCGPRSFILDCIEVGTIDCKDRPGEYRQCSRLWWPIQARRSGQPA
jgi:hypothetical protein